MQTVLIQDQSAGQCADLQQPMPGGVVAGQSRNVQIQNDPRPADTDLSDQPLEPFPVDGRGPKTAPDRKRSRPPSRQTNPTRSPAAAAHIGAEWIQSPPEPSAAWTVAFTGWRDGAGARRGAVCYATPL